jgi:uncharacterized protein DUF4012
VPDILETRLARRHRWRPAALAALIVVSLGAAGAGWGWHRVTGCRDHLQHAAGLVVRLRDQLQQVDPAATRTLARLQAETRAARAQTRDPLWALGIRLPAAGRDLRAVRTVAAVLDDLATDGLPQLVATAGLLGAGSLTPVHGRLDPTPLRLAAPQLTTAATALAGARERVAGIATAGLRATVRAAVVQLEGELGRAARTARTAAYGATLLPPMLGADGPRDYLLLVQNLAEVRATGGMPGAYLVLRADRGAIRLVDQGTAADDLRSFTAPVLTLAESDRRLYTDRLGIYPADVNLTPDFPTAATLAREMYRRRTGRTVDGVLATDPVALSYLLRVVGPVTVPGGPRLTATNAVRVLLHDAYAGHGVDQDRYSAAAAKAVFGALIGRPVPAAGLLGALVDAAGERRLLVWSAHPAENGLLGETVLAGALPASDGASPTVGVFLNDGSGAKLGYYLTQSAKLSVTPGCRADRRRELNLRFTLGSTAPRAGLSAQVLGLGLAGDPYTTRTNLSIYSPTGGAITEMRLDGAARSFSAGSDRRRAVGILTVDLAPGARRTLDVRLLTGGPAGGEGTTVTPRLWTTPGVADWPRTIESTDGCPPRR